MLQILNTLTKQVDQIKPTSDKLRMYSCGPTVYDYAHIGNMRSYIIADTIYRTLQTNQQQVDWVMNLTDVDDKTIKGTIKQFGDQANVANLAQYTQTYIDLFLQDLTKANIDPQKIRFIKVSEVIPQIQDFILKLIDKGYAYQADDGSSYFNIQKYQDDFGDYGQLVGEKFLEGKKIGARVKVDEYEKDNLSDFALWKAWDQDDAQIFWDHPTLGKGRPGWHIECSVINQVAFGNQSTHIHTGGVDLTFPHHTNEIAQSQPFYKPFVEHWIHSEHLMFDNKKMSKSLGNYTRVMDIEEKGFDALDLRYLTLQSAYNKQANFTWEALQAARNSRIKLQTSTTGQPFEQAFLDSINDNLNTAQALAIALADKDNWDAYEPTLGLLSQKQTNDQEIDLPDLPQNLQELLDQREKARKSQDFGLSDKIRDQIKSLGYEVVDTSSGQTVHKLPN
ncbi:MAG: cysteine--tRNA ligase [Candidatus Doudnabacteria bacterium]